MTETINQKIGGATKGFSPKQQQSSNSNYNSSKSPSTNSGGSSGYSNLVKSQVMKNKLNSSINSSAEESKPKGSFKSTQSVGMRTRNAFNNLGSLDSQGYTKP